LLNVTFADSAIANSALKALRMFSPSTPSTQTSPAYHLGHLAWVLEDVRKCLNYAANAVRRFEWDVKNAVNFGSRDSTDIQSAAKLAHQCAGALEMVGHPQAAKLVRTMGEWIKTMVNRPEAFVEDTTAVFEGACRALLDFFDGLLKGSMSSPVALFVQYRALLQLYGADRIHPADLWPGVGQWSDRAPPVGLTYQRKEPIVRKQLDDALLPVLRNLDSGHAHTMVGLCCGLAASSQTITVQRFWSIAAAFFEVLSAGELPNDVYVRRTAARILPAYRILADDAAASLDELTHELLFFCVLVRSKTGVRAEMPVLKEVCKAYDIRQGMPLDYEAAPFGRFDPVQLAQLRQHLSVAAEGWSALAGGDIARATGVVSHFAEVSSTVLRLHPESAALVSALSAVIETTARQAKMPSPTIAIEVATAILYLEVAYDDLDLASHTMEQRSVRLAARLRHALAGGEPMPIERWMEALYRRVADRKALGTVVGELAISLVEIEKCFEAFVRNPNDVKLLEAVPLVLGHMRGVYSVLGLDQAALGALRMRTKVEQLLAPDSVSPEITKKWTVQLVNSLSAMGFLIDMLRYQPSMAKELFGYDEIESEFRLMMEREKGREHADGPAQVQTFDAVEVSASTPKLAELMETAQVAGASQSPQSDIQSGTFLHPGYADDEEIRHIFMEEARKVLNEGKACAIALSLTPSNRVALESLRRAFHTLKGSARMVGIEDFGEAAWAFEELLNAYLADQRPVSEVLLTQCDDALDAMNVWIDAISKRDAAPCQAQDFRICADALRLEGRNVRHPLSRRVTIKSKIVGNSESDLTLEPAKPSLYQGATHVGIGADKLAANFITIGRLQLRLDFFEVFINEAGLWAAELQSSIEKWGNAASVQALQSAAGLAHALNGSASAVGFTGLATVSHSIERALESLAIHVAPTTQCKALLYEAAQEVNRLLDAFASGMLVKPSTVIMDALAGLLSDTSTPTDLLQQIAPTGAEPIDPEPNDPSQAVDASVGNPSTDNVIAEPAAMATALQPVDDLESQDVLDADLWPIFVEEGTDLVRDLGKSLRQWAVCPTEHQPRAQALRILHTLKGSARLAGALRLGELAHRMESTMEGLAEATALQDAEIGPLLRYLEQLELLFLDLTSQAQAPEFRTDLAVPSSAPVVHLRTLNGSAIRVRAQVLDRLIDQAGEVMTGRTRMDQRLGQLHSSVIDLGRNLDRLRNQLRELEIQSELQVQSRRPLSPESTATFDPLELDRYTGVQEVVRMMSESVADVDVLNKGLQSEVESAQEDLLGQGRRAKELTSGLLRMRLVEFESISDRLYGVVRQAAKEIGKQIRLDIRGGSIEIDRGVLDRMTPSFEHMLRNAVVHGIESADVRLAGGKPATGAIAISVLQDGSDVSVSFQDDGAGLQLEKIRVRAISAGLMQAAQTLSYEEAAKLLFIPGFSTAEHVTELAGRGIGMDVVLSDISAIGGRILTEPALGGGTCFQLVFPLTTAVTQIVMLRMDTVTIGVPANLLDTVMRIPADALKGAYATGLLQTGDGLKIPFFWAGAILGVSSYSHSDKANIRQQSIAVIRSAGQRIALHVDEVLGNREVVVKNLGVQLSQLPGLVGISVLASGAVVLIYNPVALMNFYGEGASNAQSSASSDQVHLPTTGVALQEYEGHALKNSPLVLVVDDSITVRRITQRLLSRGGFRVALASDGIQALEMLRDERPALVLSDIEMPRMDGMELTRQIRADSQLFELPIIVITSRTAQKHRDHAIALGANHYLGKPYSETELLKLVRSYSMAAELV